MYLEAYARLPMLGTQSSEPGCFYYLGSREPNSRLPLGVAIPGWKEAGKTI